MTHRGKLALDAMVETARTTKSGPWSTDGYHLFDRHSMTMPAFMFTRHAAAANPAAVQQVAEYVADLEAVLRSIAEGSRRPNWNPYIQMRCEKLLARTAPKEPS